MRCIVRIRTVGLEGSANRALPPPCHSTGSWRDAEVEMKNMFGATFSVGALLAFGRRHKEASAGKHKI